MMMMMMMMMMMTMMMRMMVWLIGCMLQDIKGVGRRGERLDRQRRRLLACGALSCLRLVDLLRRQCGLSHGAWSSLWRCDAWRLRGGVAGGALSVPLSQRLIGLGAV